jgi:two-component system, NarL family, response regulator NreC
MAPTAGGAHSSHRSSRPTRQLVRSDPNLTALAEAYLRTGRLSFVVVVSKPFDQLAFSMALPTLQDIELIECSDNLESAAEICHSLNPDGVVIDLSFENGASYAAGRQLLESGCVKSVAFHDSRFALSRARAALTSGTGSHYFTRSFQLRELCTAIRTRTNIDDVFISTLEHLHGFDKHRFLRLSAQELHVMEWMADGHSVRSIAEKMGLAESTVDNHKSRMMKKLNIHRGSQLVRIAVETGLVDWDQR